MPPPYLSLCVAACEAVPKTEIFKGHVPDIIVRHSEPSPRIINIFFPLCKTKTLYFSIFFIDFTSKQYQAENHNIEISIERIKNKSVATFVMVYITGGYG